MRTARSSSSLNPQSEIRIPQSLRFGTAHCGVESCAILRRQRDNSLRVVLILRCTYRQVTASSIRRGSETSHKRSRRQMSSERDDRDDAAGGGTEGGGGEISTGEGSAGGTHGGAAIGRTTGMGAGVA